MPEAGPCHPVDAASHPSVIVQSSPASHFLSAALAFAEGGTKMLLAGDILFALQFRALRPQEICYNSAIPHWIDNLRNIPADGVGPGTKLLMENSPLVKI